MTKLSFKLCKFKIHNVSKWKSNWDCRYNMNIRINDLYLRNSTCLTSDTPILLANPYTSRIQTEEYEMYKYSTIL